MKKKKKDDKNVTFFKLGSLQHWYHLLLRVLRKMLFL